MLKATLQSAVLLGLLAWSVPGFAEVQNVKVGGDITVRAFHRENLDLREGTENTATTGAETADTSGAGSVPLDSEDDFLMSSVGVNIGADLTENVSAFIRLANERDWNNTSAEAANDFDISQAYVTLKELFYSPLTLRVGQQPITWGRGLILGSNLLPSIVLNGDDRNASITSNEFTDFTAFDAIRATLDLSGISGIGAPLTLDYVYIKQDENTATLPDDITINGLNLSTRFDEMSSEVETYFVNLRDKNLAGCSAQSAATQLNGRQTECKNGSVNTLGLRGSLRPVESSSVWGELAYQFGQRVIDLEGQVASGDSQQAWMANFGTDYTFTDVASTPKVGAEWRFYSGKDVDNAVLGWRPIAPGYFTTAIREFQTRSTIGGFYPVDQTGVTSGASNQHELAIFGSVTPIEDLTVNQRLSWFNLAVPSIAPSDSSSGGKRNRFVGTEWDTVVTYNYTDDVQFGVIYGIFFPGNVYRTAARGTTNGDNTAQELITTVGVKF